MSGIDGVKCGNQLIIAASSLAGCLQMMGSINHNQQMPRRLDAEINPSYDKYEGRKYDDIIPVK